MNKQDKTILKKYFNHLKRQRVLGYFKLSFWKFPLIRNIPIINNSDKFIGGTDYIDNIRTNDLEHPIMIGLDRFKRPYLVLKYTCQDDEYTQLNENIKLDNPKKIYMLTLFQRYTNDNNTWVKSDGNDSIAPLLNQSSVSLTKKDKDIIQENIISLMTNKKCYYHQYFNRIETFDEKIEKTEINCKLHE